MATAKDIFKIYEWANWVTKDGEKTCLWSKRPSYDLDDRKWFCDEGKSLILDDSVEIDDFKGFHINHYKIWISCIVGKKPAYSRCINKLGYFWDDDKNTKVVGKLLSYHGIDDKPFEDDRHTFFKNFEPLECVYKTLFYKG